MTEPAISQACIRVVPSSTSISVPSTISCFGIVFIRSLLCRHASLLRLVIVDTLFDHRTEVLDQTLYRPRRRVAERADGVAFDLFRDVKQQIDLALLGFATLHALEHPPHPARAFAAGRA